MGSGALCICHYKFLGLGVGFTLYHAVNLTLGYCIGRFQLFGGAPEKPKSFPKNPEIPWGEFKVEVIFFPRGAPRGDPQGGSPGGGPRGGSRELFGLPIWRKKSKDKTPGVFFHAAFDFDTPGP